MSATAIGAVGPSKDQRVSKSLGWRRKLSNRIV